MGGNVIGDVIGALTTMVEIPGGSFLMGSEGFYPEEAPIREIEVSDFAIDRDPVTQRGAAIGQRRALLG